MNQAIAQTLAAQNPHMRLTDGQYGMENSKKKRYNFWVYLGGRSQHDTGNMPNTNEEDNPAFGGAVTTQSSFYGIRPIAHGMRVLKNSKEGTTTVVGFGAEICYESAADFCASLSRVRVQATDPVKNRKASGYGTMPTLGIGKDRYRIYITKMAPKVNYIYVGIGF